MNTLYCSPSFAQPPGPASLTVNRLLATYSPRTSASFLSWSFYFRLQSLAAVRVPCSSSLSVFHAGLHFDYNNTFSHCIVVANLNVSWPWDLYGYQRRWKPQSGNRKKEKVSSLRDGLAKGGSGIEIPCYRSILSSHSSTLTQFILIGHLSSPKVTSIVTKLSQLWLDLQITYQMRSAIGTIVYGTMITHHEMRTWWQQNRKEFSKAPSLIII